MREYVFYKDAPSSYETKILEKIQIPILVILRKVVYSKPVDKTTS